MRTAALFDAKNFGFSKFMVCPHGQGGLNQCGYFADNVGLNFRGFVRTTSIDGPLFKTRIRSD